MAYTVRPLRLGAEVIGINLMDTLEKSVVDKIIDDTHKHRILVFKDQHSMTPDRQIEIARWFGDIDWESYSKHPASPSKLVSESVSVVSAMSCHCQVELGILAAVIVENSRTMNF